MNKKSVAVGVYRNPAIQKFLKEGVLSSIQINSLIVEELMIDEDLLEEAPEDTVRKIFGNHIRAVSSDDPKAKLAKAEEVLVLFQTAFDTKDISKIAPDVAKSGEDAKIEAYLQGIEKVLKAQAPDGNPRSTANKLRAAVGAAETPEEKVKIMGAVAGENGGDEEAAKKVIAAVDPKAAENPKVVAAVVDAAGGATPGGEGEEADGALEVASNIASGINNTIGWLTVAALVIPGGQPIAAALKTAQAPAAILDSALALANKDYAGAATALFNFIPINKIPGFNKIAVPFAKKALEQIGKEITEEAAKQLADVTFRATLGKIIEKITSEGGDFGGKKYTLDDLKNENSETLKGFLKEEKTDLWDIVEPHLGGDIPGEEAEGELTPEGQYAVDTVVAMFLKTAPVLPTEKRNLEFLSNDNPESKPLQAGLANLAKTDEKVKPFTNPDHPEYKKVVAAIDKKWQGGETPGEEDEPSGVKEAIDSLDDVVIEQLRSGTEEFISNFMKVSTLTDQSRIFKGVWDPIRHIAQVLKGALDKEKAALTDRTPGETMQEEEEASSGNRVIAASRVVRRHIDRVKEILPVYEEMIDKQIKGGKIEMGSHATLKKYGDQDPKRLLYKILKLIVKDIVGLSTHIGTLSKKPGKKPGQDDQETVAPGKGGTDGTVGVRRGPVSSAGVTRQPSVSGRTIRGRMQEIEEPAEESRGDKIKKVAGAYVNSKGLLAKLIDTLVEARADNTQRPDRPKPTPEEPAPVPEGVVIEKAPRPETDEGAVANSAKNQAIAIYKLLRPIKEYFPTANPLQSEYEMKTAVKAFKQAISGLTVIVEQLQEFKSDSQLPPELLSEFEGKLDAIKKTLIEYFGLKDIGDGQLGIVSSEGRPANTPATADQEDTGDVIIPLGDAPPGTTTDPAADKKQEINSTKELYLLIRKGIKASELTAAFQKLQSRDSKIAKVAPGSVVKERPYQWYINTFSKFWAYYEHYKLAPKDVEEEVKNALAPQQASAIGGEGNMSAFMKKMNAADKAFAPHLSAFFAQAPRNDLSRHDLLLKIMQLGKKIIRGASDPKDPKKGIGGLLDKVNLTDAFAKATMLFTVGPEEIEAVEEPGESVEVEEFDERLIRILKPIIREQLKRSKYG